MNKEDYYRRVIIHGITDNDLDALPIFDGWEYQSGYKFGNSSIGAGVEILFRKASSGDYISQNVLPIDGANLNIDEYYKGFDSSEEQMDDIKDDVLYDFCICFNRVKEKVFPEKLILCGIEPLVTDRQNAVRSGVVERLN